MPHVQKLTAAAPPLPAGAETLYAEPLYLMGLSFLLLTCRLLFLSSYCLMMPLVMFILGGPSAGKGTQCVLIVKKCSYTHLSARELISDERKNSDSHYGELIEKYIKSGKSPGWCGLVG